MQDVEKALEEGIWAIAYTPSGKYIGQLWSVDGKEPSPKAYFVEHLTNPMCMKYAQEYHTALVPQPGVNEHGQQVMQLMRRIEAFCVSRCFDVERLSIYLTPTDIVFFEDMSRGDREWHKNLVRNGIRGALQQRAASSDIILPGVNTGHA